LGCAMLKIPYCVDSRLIDGIEAVSPTHRPRFTHQKHFSTSGANFFQTLNNPKGSLEGWSKLKNVTHLIGSRTRDLPVCSIAPQPTKDLN
jgi:hypothetical protein